MKRKPDYVVEKIDVSSVVRISVVASLPFSTALLVLVSFLYIFFRWSGTLASAKVPLVDFGYWYDPSWIQLSLGALLLYVINIALAASLSFFLVSFANFGLALSGGFVLNGTGSAGERLP